jgi:mannose/cellobiose epimerase-like protein (N-acyl-D-glucosamine 2-epimerase family)
VNGRPTLVATNRELASAIKDGIDTARRLGRDVDVVWGAVIYTTGPGDTPETGYRKYMAAAKVARAAETPPARTAVSRRMVEAPPRDDVGGPK